MASSPGAGGADFFRKGAIQAMRDAVTQTPLRVSIDEGSPPYIMLLFDQLGDVCRLLDEHGIRYSVEEEASSLDGGPETVIIDLARDADVEAIQAILDSAQ
jgi:hypothetical protein